MGFVPVKQRGTSHRRFVHPVAGIYLNIQPEAQGTAKPYQVRQFLKEVDKHGLRLEDEREEEDE